MGWGGGGVDGGKQKPNVFCFDLTTPHGNSHFLKQSTVLTLIHPLRFFFVGTFSFLRIQNNPQNQKNVKLEHDGLVCKQKSQNSPCVALDRKNGCLNFSPL